MASSLSRAGWLCLLATCLWSGAGVVWGQRPSESTELRPATAETETPRYADGPTAPASDGRITGESETARPRVFPETLYLRDKDGNLVPVLVNMSYEEFTTLYELKQQLERPDVEPRFVIERLEMEAVVEEEEGGGPGNSDVTARLRWNAKVELRVLSDTTVRVPLDFAGHYLTETPQFEGEGKHFLQHVGGETGYVLWVQGAAESQHVVKLQFVSDVDMSAEEPQVRFVSPAATHSQLLLTVPHRDVTARVSDSSTVTAREATGERSVFEVVGLAGLTTISWGKRETAKSPGANVFEVRGDTLVEVRGPGSLLTDTRFTFVTYGQPLNEVRLRLPRGARLVSPQITEAYELTLIETETTEPAQESPDAQPAVEDQGEGTLAVVTFAAPAQAPTELRLLFDQNWDPADPDEEFRVGDLQVLGALRHYGTVTVTTEGDWRLTWGQMEGVTRLAEAPEPWRGRSVVGAFSYFRQPFALPIRVSAKTTSIRAEPIFVYRVGRTEIEMEAIFSLRVTGAPAANLRVDMTGWQLTGFKDLAFVATESLDASQVSPLDVPLTRPRTGAFDLHLLATKPLSDSDPHAVLELPRFVDGSSSAPLVVIVPDDNVALNSPMNLADRVTAENIPGDLQAMLAGELDLSRAICFRYRGTSDEPALEYELRPKTQSIHATSDVKVVAEENGTTVCTQTLNLDVRFVPLTEIALLLPDEASLLGEPQVLLDQEPLTGSGAVFPLPYPRVGNFSVEVKYALSQPLLAAAEHRTYNVPLIRVRSLDFDETSIHITTPRSINVQPRGDGYRIVSQGEGLADSLTNTLQLYSTRTAATLGLSLIRGDAEQQFSTRVESVVLQTWATEGARRDRCVFRLVSRDPVVTFALPASADLRNLQVVVDGFEVNSYESKSKLEVSVPIVDRSEANHTIELVYPVSGSALRLGEIAVPQISGVTWLGRFYWHLVLPSRQHLLMAPTMLECEDRWHWSGTSWVHQSRDVQPRWESQVAATTQQIPAAGANQYFFSAVGTIEPFSATTSRKSWFIIFAASCVLGVVLLLPRLAARRRGTTLVLVTVLCLSVALWRPVPSLMLLQGVAVVQAVLILWQLAMWLIVKTFELWERYTVGRFASAVPVRRDEQGRMTGSSRISIASTAAMPPVPFSQSDSQR